MPVIPCAHCGLNFMKSTEKENCLCNNCKIREETKNPKTGEKMDNVDILIKCPKELQKEIEEICINQGKSFTEYFLELHKAYTQENCLIDDFQKKLTKRKKD